MSQWRLTSAKSLTAAASTSSKKNDRERKERGGRRLITFSSVNSFCLVIMQIFHSLLVTNHASSDKSERHHDNGQNLTRELKTITPHNSPPTPADTALEYSLLLGTRNHKMNLVGPQNPSIATVMEFLNMASVISASRHMGDASCAGSWSGSPYDRGCDCIICNVKRRLYSREFAANIVSYQSLYMQSCHHEVLCLEAYEVLDEVKLM